MKTTLFRNMYAALAALFISLFALPQQAQAEDYNLKIAGKWVTSANCNDLSVIPGVTGTASYDPATKTLTLDNATINQPLGSPGIDSEIDGLTIRVKGTVNVTAGGSALVFDEPATITGGGTLNATSSNSYGICVNNADLTIDGCTVNAKGKKHGIAGLFAWTETLTVRNATVTAESDGTNASIHQLKALNLIGCAITRPAGAAFDPSLREVALNGQAVKTKVTIKPVTTYDLNIGGMQVHSANCGDLSVIPGVTGTVKYDHSTKTLTLEDAAIAATGDDNNGIQGEIDGLTIRVKGTVNVTAKGGAALWFGKTTTLTGGGTLDATSSTNCGILANKAALTLNGLTVRAKGKWGIAGSFVGNAEPFTIKNATVTAEGNGDHGSLCRFKTLTLDGCAITQPTGAAFSASLKGVALDGQLVKEKVRIEPATRYDLKIAGTQVTSANCGDLSVIPGVTGTAKYDHSTKTLTLEDAAIAATGNFYGIWGYIDGLTVRVKGTVNVTSQERDGILFSKPATLTGGGTLNTTGGDNDSSCGIYASETNLTIDGLTVNAKGKWGIAGNDGSVETLTVRNATVTAEGDGTDGSLLGFKSLTLDGCEITRPAGAAFDAALRGIALNGQLVKEKVTISLLPVSDFVVIDGVKKPIFSYEFFDEGDNDFVLRFHLSADGKELVQIEGNRNLHIGKDIDLTKRESEHEGQRYWVVGYVTDFINVHNCHRVFTGFGKPDSDIPVFTTGTLRIDGDPAGTFTVRLKNGSIPADTNYGDGEEHTIELICSNDPTGIDTVTSAASVRRPGTYTLHGVKLNTAFDRLPAGVYIVNGKKVVKN